MNNKHTPGPWGWETPSEKDERRIALSGDSEDVLIATQDADDLCFVMTSEANANLIAAAPDLLEAARRLTKLLCADGIDSFHIRHSDEADALRDAIAKAEGRKDA